MYERCELEGKIYTYVSYNPFSPPNTHISIYVQHTQTHTYIHAAIRYDGTTEHTNTDKLRTTEEDSCAKVLWQMSDLLHWDPDSRKPQVFRP